VSAILELTQEIGNFEFTLSIFKALRAKIEHTYGIKNRIGRSFDGGFKGVLAVGQAGCGKTKTLKSIFNGLELNKTDYHGNPLGVWVPSGISTGVGLFELLTQNNSAVIVIDELDANTALHVNVLKQIASGAICRMKHREIDPTPFSGVLIGATNGIPFKKKNIDHLVAMLERFTIVHMRGKSNLDYYVTDDNYKKELPDSVWKTIADCLLNNCAVDLTEEEHDFGRSLFEEKARENLDASKTLYRQANDVMDILLFLKRFCQVDTVLDGGLIESVAKTLVNNTIHVNPSKLICMDPVERSVYDFVDCSEDHATSFTKIVEFCENNGFMVDIRTIRKILNRMVIVRILNKYNGDIFTTRSKANVISNVGVMASALNG